MNYQKPKTPTTLRVIPINTYQAARNVVSLTLKIFCRIETLNYGGMPEKGPMILCCNHQSILDPLILAAAIPRQLTFLAAGYLFDIPLLGFILRQSGVIPVQGVSLSLRAIRQAVESLDNGGTVVIFPQGGVRTAGTGFQVQPGAAFLSLKAQAPLQPAFIAGSEKILPIGNYLPRRRGKVYVNFGKPLSPPAKRNSQNFRETLNESLINSWEKLRREVDMLLDCEDSDVRRR